MQIKSEIGQTTNATTNIDTRFIEHGKNIGISTQESSLLQGVMSGKVVNLNAL